jgi:hypothetical protein
MQEDAFVEYKTIIEYSLGIVGFNIPVSIQYGIHPSFVFVLSKYRKDCIVDTENHFMTVLLPVRSIIVYPYPYYSVVGRVDLAKPDDLELLGLLLSDVLIGAR